MSFKVFVFSVVHNVRGLLLECGQHPPSSDVVKGEFHLRVVGYASYDEDFVFVVVWVLAIDNVVYDVLGQFWSESLPCFRSDDSLYGAEVVFRVGGAERDDVGKMLALERAVGGEAFIE